MSFMRYLKVGLISVGLFSLVSCGSGSNNDQGTSFLALGWYTIVENEIVPSTQVFINLFSDTSTADVNGDGRAEFRLMGIENRLETQFIRITRVDCSYDVQGADPSLVIPNDSISKSFVLGANPGSNVVVASGDAELQSEDENTRPQTLFMLVPAITTDIFAFLNANINLLPELPFTMTTTCAATGVTQSGDALQTNPVSISVLFSDETDIPAPSGGNGGNIPSFTSTGTVTIDNGSTGTVTIEE